METEVVQSYSGSIYGERPAAFVWEGQRVEVKQILSRWRTPEGRAFRLLTAEGAVFELFYHEPEDRWSIRKLSDSPLNPEQEAR